MTTAFSDRDGERAGELHERRRRLCLGLLGLGLLAACVPRGELEPPSDEPSSDPFEEEDEDRMKEEG
ncbi:MAG: hypothetical protein ACREH6_03365 [Geminicoccaceae bacterium]